MFDLLHCKDQCLVPAYAGLSYPAIASDLWLVISDCQYKNEYNKVGTAPCQHPFLLVMSAAANGEVEQLQDALNNVSYMGNLDLPVSGLDLRRAALDLAVRSKQLACAQVLRPGLTEVPRSFLVAAAESGCSEMLRWALQTWCSQFNCVHGFGPGSVEDLHAALRAACQLGNGSAVDHLLSCCHGVRSYKSAAVALHYACACNDATLVASLLESKHLMAEIQRGGSDYFLELAGAVAQCLFTAVRTHNSALANVVLAALCYTSGLAAAKPLLGPYMQPLLEQVSLAGEGVLLQQLLVQLPEFYEAFNASSLLAAISAGHSQLATQIRWLLAMRPEMLYLPELQPGGSPAVLQAELSGQVAQAVAAEDVVGVEQLLRGGGLQLQYMMDRLKQAVKVGNEHIIRLLLPSVDNMDGCIEACVALVCGAAAEAGQLMLLQSLCLEYPAVQLHLRSSSCALSRYLASSLVCGHLEMACWLLGQSLTPWQVLNTALRIVLLEERGSLAKAMTRSTMAPNQRHPLLLLTIKAAEIQPTQELALEFEVLLLLAGAAGNDPLLLQLLGSCFQSPRKSGPTPRLSIADAVALVHV